MNVAIVGCGFVADLYMMTMPLHPELRVVGAYDRVAERTARFSSFHGVPPYEAFDQVLTDDRVETVINLTNPSSHFDVSNAALRAGKHVYSEKPLATSIEQAEDLAATANGVGRRLAGAPCTLLGPTAQTLWRALRDGVAGDIKLVYAELDEGMIPVGPYTKWYSPSGVQWPYKDEFETGCTLEHAGYCLTWLVAFFGPATEVTAYSSTRIADKRTPVPLERNAPDFSVACVTFASGVVARITNSIVAPHDHAFRIIGDDGVLHTAESWSIEAPVYYRSWLRVRRRLMLHPWRRRLRLQRSDVHRPKSGGAQRMDFAGGVAELAESIRESRPCRLSAEFALHITELSLVINNAASHDQPHKMRNGCPSIEPMPWAVH